MNRYEVSYQVNRDTGGTWTEKQWVIPRPGECLPGHKNSRKTPAIKHFWSLIILRDTFQYHHSYVKKNVIPYFLTLGCFSTGHCLAGDVTSSALSRPVSKRNTWQWSTDAFNFLFITGLTFRMSGEFSVEISWAAYAEHVFWNIHYLYDFGYIDIRHLLRLRLKKYDPPGGLRFFRE